MYHRRFTRVLRTLARLFAINRIIGIYRDYIGYEKRFNNSLMSLISETSVVWDIGANHGLYTDAFYDVINDHGTIIAFEPNRDLAAQLEEQYRDVQNVCIYNVAVSNFTGSSAFQLGTDDLAATSSLVNNDGTYQVEVKKLSELVSTLGVPNVVKVDIEGAEANLLDDIVKNVEVFRNIVFFMEIHFAIIEQNYNSSEFFSALDKVNKLSQDFIWIDASHLRFKI